MTKLTEKQERFCQAYIETGNGSEAYRRAYNAEKMKPETINVKAAELLKNGKVAVRVEQLQAEHRERHNITVDSLTAELEEARLLAMADEKGASAAVSAVMGKAKLHGLVVDKSERKTQKNSIPEHLAKLPLETQTMIIEKLREIAGRKPEMDKEPDSGPVGYRRGIKLS